MRSRMIDVKCNYKMKYSVGGDVSSDGLKCPLCLVAEDNQEHVANCVKLDVVNDKQYEYYDMFGEDQEKITFSLKSFMEKWKKREELLFSD